MPLPPSLPSQSSQPSVATLLDYGAGNVRSVRNAIRHLGFDIKDATHISSTDEREEISKADSNKFDIIINQLDSLHQQVKDKWP
ncbi:hypothetical protein Q3G72_005904 [Acer saccharum]|nr:hypothetical protein Q3G72_005904 [Acer saccharum]